MERGYLVAVLAVVATFTGLSHSFRSLDHWWMARIQHESAVPSDHCPTTVAARALARIEAHLRPHYAPQQQLLAELNAPSAGVPGAGFEDFSRQEAVRCARLRAMQDMERARQDMLHMQRDMVRAGQNVRIDPLSLQIDLPADLEKQIEQSTKMAAQIAGSQIKVQVFTNQPDRAVKSTGSEQ
ncbi:MAG TPA: hypothetical protein VMD98_07780 [Bryocella sp.]|nr:hypothetical protein [Bryocella sp.]